MACTQKWAVIGARPLLSGARVDRVLGAGCTSGGPPAVGRKLASGGLAAWGEQGEQRLTNIQKGKWLAARGTCGQEVRAPGYSEVILSDPQTLFPASAPGTG